MSTDGSICNHVILSNVWAPSIVFSTTVHVYPKSENKSSSTVLTLRSKQKLFLKKPTIYYIGHGGRPW